MYTYSYIHLKYNFSYYRFLINKSVITQQLNLFICICCIYISKNKEFSQKLQVDFCNNDEYSIYIRMYIYIRSTAKNHLRNDIQFGGYLRDAKLLNFSFVHIHYLYIAFNWEEMLVFVFLFVFFYFKNRRFRS